MPQTFQRHALQNHPARAGERGEKQSFAAENSGANAAHHLDVVIHARLKRHQVTSLDLQRFARREIVIHMIAARMNEHQTWPNQLLQNEAFATQQARAQALHHGDIERHGALRKQEAIALHHDRLSRRQIKHLNFAWIMAGKTNLARATAIGAEISKEQRIAHHLALQCAQNLVADRLARHAGGPVDVGPICKSSCRLRHKSLDRAANARAQSADCGLPRHT